jgi:hypothetical protein
MAEVTYFVALPFVAAMGFRRRYSILPRQLSTFP